MIDIVIHSEDVHKSNAQHLDSSAFETLNMIKSTLRERLPKLVKKDKDIVTKIVALLMSKNKLYRIFEQQQE